MKTRALTLLLAACAASAACAAQACAGRGLRASAFAPGPGAAGAEDEEINGRPLKLPLARPKVVVEKAARRLTLYSDGERVRVFPVALGFEPAGDKVRQGDGRTPEGDFYVCVKNGRSKFYLSLGLSYPNAEDAARGLEEGLITRAQHGRILDAVARGARPPWDTPLGGEIFIHGGGTARDWTWGCVALENEHVKELFDALPLGTPVRIER